MIHTGRNMRALDRSVNFALIRAPIESVKQATGGIMRATANGTLVNNGETKPPATYGNKPDGTYDLRARALVSRPARADVVLVEFNFIHDLALGLSMMLPDVEVLSFRSNFQATNCYYHEFRVYRAGQKIRHVDADVGNRKSGVSFLAEGVPHRSEDVSRYTAKAVSQKFNRTALLEVARKNWLDVEKALFERQLDETTAFTGLDALESIVDLELLKSRTTDFAEAYARAVALGIGPGEDPISKAESQNAFMQRIETTRQYSEDFFKALRRARRDPAKVRDVYDLWMQDDKSPEDFKPMGMKFAEGLNPNGDKESLDYMRTQDALWEQAQQWEGRIVQTVVDQIDHVDSLDQIDFAQSRSVIGLNKGRYPDMETAMRAEMGAIFADIGIRFDPKGPILSEEGAERSCMQQMGAENQRSSDEMNGITSPFSMRTVTLTQDDLDDLT